MSFVADEIESQPQSWARAAELAARFGGALPDPDARVAVVGCGTSWYMAQCCAALREAAGRGETDAFPASEFPPARGYDHVVALTRSGTTTEILRLLDALPEGGRSTVITTDPSLPAAQRAGAVIALDFADERSVVQTRFATSVLALWRAHLGADLDAAIEDARAEIAREVPAELIGREHFVYLGTGWTVGLANEAALKVREASGSWAESYPAMEFRHGPISAVGERSVAWFFGAPPVGLVAETEAAGAVVVHAASDPMAQLIGAQRLAVAVAARKGLDPDSPRNLTRSIVLA
ncbi:MAG TPA: sugar isomerase [Jatrophihabitans sp.]|jgi:fructoselysine-6-P-deglycase FrlB-like protein|nr:sugar isomerase [Jatrophihabitans sp.]